ncbi:MAG TPA: Pycsar system effector family protein [Cyclobacteriaceae bacterium]
MHPSEHAVIDQAKEHVKSLFRSKRDDRFVYHNESHTERVVLSAKEIAAHYKLKGEDYDVLIVAAWFHDIGYFDDASHHEAMGAKLAEDFLKKQKADSAFIERVKAGVLATRMPQQPTNLLEEILCDADLFHLGSDEFFDKNKLMRKEYQLRCDANMDKDTWRARTITLLTNHHYHTDYAKRLLDDGKKRNLAKLKEKQKDKEPEIVQSDTVKSEKKNKSDRPDRGVETMFRITSNNHQRLSDMADNKAQILITVNSIILSVLISVLLRKLEENPNLIAPVVLLLSVNLVAIVFSILATRPHVSAGIFTKKDVNEKKVNLLFFGNFYKMNLEDYTNSVFQMMDDRDYLYRSLIKDVYAQGVVLGRKYKLLRVAYNVFMFGIVISVIAFLIASFPS